MWSPGPARRFSLTQTAFLLARGRAAVLAPTYAEHGRVAELAGHNVVEMAEIGQLADARIAIVVNPNNPDGRVVAKDTLLALADRLRRRGGLLLVDEAFMDVGPDGASLGEHVEEGNIVVLRSFGKFYGLPGVRLSFALAAPNIAARLAAALGPWPVSGAAIAIGTEALGGCRLAGGGAQGAGRSRGPARCRAGASGAQPDRRHVAIPFGAGGGSSALVSDPRAGRHPGAALRRAPDLAALRPPRCRMRTGNDSSAR